MDQLLSTKMSMIQQDNETYISIVNNNGNNLKQSAHLVSFSENDDNFIIAQSQNNANKDKQNVKQQYESNVKEYNRIEKDQQNNDKNFFDMKEEIAYSEKVKEVEVLNQQVKDLTDLDSYNNSSMVFDDQTILLESNSNIIKLDDLAFSKSSALKELDQALNQQAHQQRPQTVQIEEDFTPSSNFSDNKSPNKHQQNYQKNSNSRLSAFSYNHSRTSSTTIVTMTQSIIQPPPNQPQYMICPHCFHAGMTLVKQENSRQAYQAAGVCCLMGCWAGCQCVPLVCCGDRLKDNKHFCRGCGEIIVKIGPFGYKLIQ